MKNKVLKYPKARLKYSGIIGTGGIGSGLFFQLNGNQTLGREESRSGHFLDVRDYCKQHIILHYVKTLLGPSFQVVPIGLVGDDDIGRNLLQEMQETGFIMDHVEKATHLSTLFSFCFYYPDGSGGNLTTDNSASGKVGVDLIEKARSQAKRWGSGGIVLAVPEVPLNARNRLLEMGKENNSFCAASYTSEELSQVVESGTLSNIDLLALNIDEASAIVKDYDDKSDVLLIVDKSVKTLLKGNEKIKVSITAGKQGSWCWDGMTLTFFPAIKTEAKSTAGAGDAFFSGLLCGIALGLYLSEAQQLATLIAGLSVQSPHTIHKGIDRPALFEFMEKSCLSFSKNIHELLKN